MSRNRKHVRVTYSTLGSPDPLLDQYYEEDVVAAKTDFGQTFPMYIDGEWVHANDTFTSISPADTSLTIGHFQRATEMDVSMAVQAARQAFLDWSNTPWQERIELLEKVANLISERLFLLGAVISMEVGKNRLESIGEVEEAADLIRQSIHTMRENDGFVRQLESEDESIRNYSVLKPYGVWGVISPFNFPFALSAGPAGAALIAGNTVVHKPADDAPYTAFLLAQCFHDAGIPSGVYNMVTGSDEPGKALVANADVNGITFTGSYDVGKSILHEYGSGGEFVRPVVAEMGGKNAAIVTNNADLDKAAQGVMRSAFGATGQKCTACSRVYVHREVKTDFTAKLVKLTKQITVGDPTVRENYIGPLINESAYNAYRTYITDVAADGEILVGGETLSERGYFVAPTVVDNLPFDHYAWTKELFVPLVVVGEFEDKNEAMQMVNDVSLGLSAGIYTEDIGEIQWFLDHVEAGVVYVNRPAGATTGAWPGYQAFGGWKGSTGTNKSNMGHFYLQQYMREQGQTIVG